MWLWILVAIELVYVLSEFAFNAALLNVAGGATSDPDAFHSIEKVGRVLSGIGFALLVFGFYRMRSKFDGIQSELMALVSCSVICIPLMYFGQKALIDTLFVDNSTAKERVDAKYIALYKQGIITGAAKNSDYPFIKFDDTNPEDLTFMSIIGIANINNVDVLNWLRGSKDNLIRGIATQKSFAVLDSAYSDYRKVKVSVDKSWFEYKAASDKYLSLRSPSDNDVKIEWDKYQVEVGNHWVKYQHAQRDFLNTVGAKLKKSGAYDRMGHLYDAMRICSRTYRCDRAKEEQRKLSVKITGKEHHIKTWCYSSSRDNGGIVDSFLFKDGLNSYSYEGDLVCPSNKRPDSYNSLKMRAVAALENQGGFIKETGYPLDIHDKTAFAKHKKTLSKSVQVLAEKGVKLSPNWTGDYASFKTAVVKKMRDSSSGKWEDSAKAFGDIKPGLSYAEFLKTDVVMTPVENALGHLRVKSRYLAYSKQDFHDRMLFPSIHSEMTSFGNSFDVDEKEYADGGAKEDEGKNYIRTVYIPPVALFFTLMFSLISLSKLPLRVLTIYWVKNEKEIKTKWLRFLMTIDILFILGFPVLKMSNKITRSEKASWYIKSAGDQMGGFSSAGFVWLMNVEPIIYPMGQKFLEKRGLDNRDAKFE
jgi:hypothetical protein